MSTITVRAIDDTLKARLRAQAAAHGHSMEAEVREILRQALETPPPERLGTRISDRFSGLDADHLLVPARRDRPRAPRLPS